MDELSCFCIWFVFRRTSKCVCVWVLILWSQHGRWFCVAGVLEPAAAVTAPLSILLTITPISIHTHINTQTALEKYTWII